MSTNFGFDEDFDLELEEANRANPKGSGDSNGSSRRRQKPLPILGPEIPFAKSGRFEVKITKKGKEIKKFPTELQGIILDAKFGRQQWGEENGKPRILCSTVMHSVKDRAGESKDIEGGWWQIPYGLDLTNQKYNPMGSRTKADGTPMSCIECKAAEMDGGCASKGATYIYVTAMTNEDEEMMQLQEPFIATIRTPNASAIAFQIYVRKKVAERGLRPSQVVSTLGIAKTPNGKAYQLTFELEDKVEDNVLVEAQDAFKAKMQEWEQNEAKKADEWKAKRAAAAGQAIRGVVGGDGDVPFGAADDDDFSF